MVAQRQGATAALNMLGRREKFTDVPFFWSQHYDIPINYVGHAEGWDKSRSRATLPRKTASCASSAADSVLAVATIFRDTESLQAELAMEQSKAQ